VRSENLNITRRNMPRRVPGLGIRAPERSTIPPAHRRYSDGSPDNEPVARRRVRHNAQQDIESLVAQTLHA
jgi:hypothetical protein